VASQQHEFHGNPLPFEDWKIAFRNDCKRGDKLQAFNAMEDSVLELLWREGLAPTVDALVASVAQTK
jgi:hypothetical protein